MFTVIHNYGESTFNNIAAALELALVYRFSFGRDVAVSGPRGWIWVDGEFVGEMRDNGGYCLA